MPNWHLFEANPETKRSLTWKKDLESTLELDPRITDWENDKIRPTYTRNVLFNDPIWPDQWHLENTAQLSNSQAGIDVNIVDAWAMGYTGLSQT